MSINCIIEGNFNDIVLKWTEIKIVFVIAKSSVKLLKAKIKKNVKKKKK